MSEDSVTEDTLEPGAAVVRTRGLTKRYGPLAALDALDVEIPAGPPVGIVGPNGAGKTTLFSVLCGLLRPSAGEARVLGRAAGAPALGGRVAILPQDVALIRGIAVDEQLRLFARLQGFGERAARLEAGRALELVGIRELAPRDPEALSAGMRKRVAIAQAFIGEPDLVLLDEPTAALDPDAARRVRSLIREHSDSTTFLVSSHNLDEVQDLCESVLVIERGTLVAHRPMGELLEAANAISVRLERVPGPDLLGALRALEGVSAVEADPGDARRLTVAFRDVAPETVQVRLIETCARLGIAVRDLARGRELGDQVMGLVRERSAGDRRG